ncbi:hypothetical protein ABH930_000359 [Kitasatospora sp. GAS204A]|uniref:DUF461 domain-containing protein n=1 Tax=unclassified Kitasatospora TaxID=2633591 RepID=UPI002474DA9A|nr:DUF461 domain-containing protein [Kitasatospora sp. GAS204B]MDH6116940.1 hypothetical protein [Kitasatospora sp. GAS204B]
MSRSLRRGGTAAIVLALAAVSLSACSAGSSAETQTIKPNTPATSLGTDLKLNGIVVVVSQDQSPGQPGPANLTVNISNTGSTPQTLTNVTVGGVAATLDDASGAPLPGGIVIPANSAVALGASGQPSARVASATLALGGFTPTSFSFSSAGKVDASALVNPAQGPYESFGPVMPSGSAAASASGSAAASTSPAASGSAAASTGASTSATASSSTTGSPSSSPTH